MTVSAKHGGISAPQPLPDDPDIEQPRDEPYGGILRLYVDATDLDRRIYRVRQIIPVRHPGANLTLLYPMWLPGFHAPQAPIELFAGLAVTAGDETLTWKRHPVTVNAFDIEVPDFATEIVAEFQFLSPTDPAQGRVIVTPEMLALQWNTVVLYPAGHFARQIEIQPSLTLPKAWQLACALEQEGRDGDTVQFQTTTLDVLVDSPVLAGCNFRRIPLDDAGQVHLNVAAEQPHQIAATPEQIAPHRALVEQADRLFQARHFDHFDMLLGLSDEMTGIGIEHHRSSDSITASNYFAAWNSVFVRRETVAHEYVHSWNGKHRRGADSWTPSFEKPIHNSLMWVYEGQTQYWGRVLCARSGLWTMEQALGALAQTAARYDARPGSRWRPTIDTTRDPIIVARNPLPWTSWQRSEDYYSEGALIWLDVDTRLRELSGDAGSLDDFARSFFGRNDGVWVTTDTYVLDDVVDALNAIAPFDWRGFFTEQLARTHVGAPLAGIARGGYRLVYDTFPNPYEANATSVFGSTDLSHSLGLTISKSGAIGDVLWEGPAFEAGLTVGTKVVAIGGRAFSTDQLSLAIKDAMGGKPIELIVTKAGKSRIVAIPYHDGPRFPRLERVEGTRSRLSEILSPR
jgi:predicted metalloprotease with PDZ domain